MVKLQNGLIVLIALIGLLASTQLANAQTPPTTPPPGAGTSGTGGNPSSANIPKSYASFPQTAGQRTLINFNDYNEILANSQAYSLQRYGIGDFYTKNKAPLDGVQAKQGKEIGQPISGWARDPNGKPDLRKYRDVTEVDKLFTETDSLRPNQDYEKNVRTTRSASTPGAEVPTADLPLKPAGAPAAKDDLGANQYVVSQEDMTLDKWLVQLNSSARTIPNRADSYAKEVWSIAADYKDPKNFTKYLGVRVHFPTHKYNAYAKITPAYYIPVYDSRGLPINYSKFNPKAVMDECKDNEACPKFSYNGVIHNVKQIKNIVAKVSGRNYPHGIAVRLRDQDGDVSEYFLGYLDFAGWRYLRWDNPNYTTSYSAEELFRIPLYPTNIPYRVFDSFIIYRNGNTLGGDFVTYVEWVKMDFDLAVSPEDLKDINVDDDAWWYVIRDQNTARNKALLARYAEEIDLRGQVEARMRRLGAMPGAMPVESSTDTTKLVPGTPK